MLDVLCVCECVCDSLLMCEIPHLKRTRPVGVLATYLAPSATVSSEESPLSTISASLL